MVTMWCVPPEAFPRADYCPTTRSGCNSGDFVSLGQPKGDAKVREAGHVLEKGIHIDAPLRADGFLLMQGKGALPLPNLMDARGTSRYWGRWTRHCAHRLAAAAKSTCRQLYTAWPCTI